MLNAELKFSSKIYISIKTENPTFKINQLKLLTGLMPGNKILKGAKINCKACKLNILRDCLKDF